jgi:2-oxoglutarate ferredoxin oxidoreductase subunit gamma
MTTIRREIRLAGFGGQGIILAGYLLGKAAALYDGQQAVFTQAYGPEARGGACNADVVLSNAPVGYPEVSHPDVLAIMSQEAADLFVPRAAADAQLLIDADLVHVSWPGRVRSVPATRLADELGRRIVANIIMLGFLSGVTGLVSPTALEEAIRSSVRPQTVDLNLRALQSGYAQATRVGSEVAA